MTNEQLAALLRPYLQDIADLHKSAKHVVAGEEAMLLGMVERRLEMLTKTLGETIIRLDHPLISVR